MPNQSLIVDGSKGIANVVIFARSKVSRVFDGAKKGGQQLFDQKNCLKKS